MMTDPLLTNTKNNSKYKDIVGRMPRFRTTEILLVLPQCVNQGLLEFILESFFQCAQVNSCVFAELSSSQINLEVSTDCSMLLLIP